KIDDQTKSDWVGECLGERVVERGPGSQVDLSRQEDRGR
ncbi:MAG: hypothetical protein QOC92_1233, partial [Acidimicrobiaceae bacterium]